MPSDRPVLVVDDDDSVRDVVAEFLQAKGFAVAQATNGLEGLLAVKRLHPVAVVIDLAMPRLGGLEALKRIRRFDPDIRVVVVTGHADDAVVQEALALGARAVLAKPVDLAELGTAVSSDRAQVPAAAPAPGSSPVAAPRTRILIVDDDEALREVLAEFLVGRGAEVRMVDSAAAAIRSLVERPVDILLLDIDMPGLKGVDALPAIKAIAPDTAVIMVSGTDDAETAKRALALGAFDYVTKPIDFDYLMHGIEAALAMRTEA
jgi:DNA-binding NtrC family response regulator